MGVVWTFLLSSILSLLFLPPFGRRPDISRGIVRLVRVGHRWVTGIVGGLGGNSCVGALCLVISARGEKVGHS